MKLVHKMGITLGVVVFLAAGLGIAGGLSVVWMRRNAAEMEEVTKHSAMIEDFKSKTRQWVAAAEAILNGEGVKDFFHISNLLLEERFSTLLNQHLPADELKLVDSASFHFYKARGQLEGLLVEGNPLKGGGDTPDYKAVHTEAASHIKETSRTVEVLINSHKIHVEKTRAKVDKMEDIGKCISLAIPSTSILLAILLVLVMGRSVIHSVGTLVSATKTMAEGDLSKPIGLKTGDEFGEIAKAFEDMRKELMLKEQKLSQLSVTDELTGLFNRRYLNVKLEEEIARARRFHHLLSVIFIDIDYFKRYNDHYGHLEGDKVLKGLAVAILNSIRDKIDTACRYGGEEFIIIVPESSTLQALTVAERILHGFRSKPFLPKSSSGSAAPEPIYVTFSGGVATLMEGEESGEKLLHRADQALFQAKSQGKNRIVTT
ncbi:MAG: diguanylate cyclase [Candidatus Brocadiales bacterium]